MPRRELPDEQVLRDELKRQGIDNFGQLVSEAARLMRERGNIDTSRWYILFGDMYVFILNDPTL